MKNLMATQWINDMQHNKQKRADNRAKEIKEDINRLEFDEAKASQKYNGQRDKAQKWLKDTEDMIEFRRFVKDKERE